MHEQRAPRLGCAAVVTKAQEILMGIRGKEPNYGKWILPGGGVKYLESVNAAVRREILEEAGLIVEPGELICVKEIIDKAAHEHRVILYWWANYVRGNLKPSSDLLDARFFTKEDVRREIAEGNTTPITLQVLREIGWS